MEFSYRRGDDDGPERWGLVRRDWAACSFGRRQSPIHLSAAAIAGGGYEHHRRPGHLLIRSYRPAAASLVNRGHDIMVRFDGDAGGVVVDGEEYTLRQMHWHSPSEHAVDGRRYDLELHMLHQSEDHGGRRYAVVAQLFDIGHRRDATLDMVIDLRDVTSVSYISVAGAIYQEGGQQEEGERGGDRRRRGSELAGEGQRRVLQVRRVSRQQVELLREAVHDGARRNARPMQAANGRGVGVYYCWPNA
uniref:Carbonic anhydrase n=1 Tax=Oryza officinalis TaxID=4535 RepID=C0JA68_9ORYZ|nr:unknown [Oryza officinalis]